MGLDARITFTSTDEDINELGYALAERIDNEFFWHHPCIKWEEDSLCGGPAHWEIDTMWQYWGPNYQRSYWPTIRAVLAFLLERVEGLQYGADEGPSSPVTQALLAEYDHAFNTYAPLDAYGKPMIRHGWGPGFELYVSKATGEHAEFRNGVAVPA